MKRSEKVKDGVKGKEEEERPREQVHTFILGGLSASLGRYDYHGVTHPTGTEGKAEA